jgi:hypothetical protein
VAAVCTSTIDELHYVSVPVFLKIFLRGQEDLLIANSNLGSSSDLVLSRVMVFASNAGVAIFV